MMPKLIIANGRPVEAASIEIVPTVPSHIATLKRTLRQEDAQEIMRFGISVQKALWFSYRRSIWRKTALVDGVVAACWGVCGSLLSHTGMPWLITTPEVKKISPLRFARIYQEEVGDMLRLFQKLENYVDMHYTSAARLLEIIGFSLSDPIFLHGAQVKKFEMRG